MEKSRRGPYVLFFKRLIDIVVSLTVLILFSWLYVILAVMVRIKLGSPVLFKQERPGKIDPKTGKEKIFRMYKYRTMTDERDENGELLPDSVRLTHFGSWLRRTSLDEIPELFNIFKGDMSIVGPRPLMVAYLPYYTEKEKHRHDVRPGLTGLAQVKGRNFLTWEEIFEFDLEYVNRCSFALDSFIIFQTAKKVLKRGEIADVQTTTVDKDGNIWVLDNGVKKRLHRPLNEEREYNAEGNRQ